MDRIPGILKKTELSRDVKIIKMSDPIRSFYRSHIPDLTSITHPTFRHFRILLPNGSFYKVQDRIRNGETLQKWLIRYRPSDVYYSTSCWLAPESLGRREKTPLSDNIFLFSDIVFDIDRSPFSSSNLELARKDALEVIRFCANHTIPVKYIAFSGSKGFHVICKDTRQYSDPDPLVREDQAKAVRREIIRQVQEAGIGIDGKITGDTRRIIRVPGTINSKTGYVCTVLSTEQLEQPITRILKYIPRVDLGTPVIPVTGDENTLRVRIISWLRNRFGVRSKPHPSFSYATFLVNAVPGIDRQIPFFTYPAHRNIGKIRDELAFLQNDYGLSDIYLYRSGTGISAFCLRTFPLRRLEKIIGASTSTNYGTILKYKQLFLRVGETRDERQNVIAGSPRYEATLEAPDANNAHFISRPHFRFFSGFPLPLRTYPRMHGTGDITLVHTVIEEG